MSGCEEGRGVVTPSLLFFLINASTTFRFFLVAKAAVKKRDGDDEPARNGGATVVSVCAHRLEGGGIFERKRKKEKVNKGMTVI